MTLYELIQQISEILTPDTNSFYDYVLHTSDDNGGFLRTCYCLRERLTKDRNISDLDKAVVCFREPFSEEVYKNDTSYTSMKMQLFYDERDLESNISWSAELGYPFSYIFDLKNKTYSYQKNEPQY